MEEVIWLMLKKVVTGVPFALASRKGDKIGMTSPREVRCHRSLFVYDRWFPFEVVCPRGIALPLLPVFQYAFTFQMFWWGETFVAV